MAEDVFGTDDIELKQLMMLVPAYSDTDRPESHALADVAEAVRWLQSLLAKQPARLHPRQRKRQRGNLRSVFCPEVS